MQDYKRYEIEQRKYSANVVLGVYDYIDENGKTKEKRDIIICPTLHKEDGDKHAEFILSCLSKPDFATVATELAKKGFLCEIVTDAWANWQFGADGKPDYKTAKPLYEQVDMFDNIRKVCWRGCYYYFDKDKKYLVKDDCGCYKDINDCIKSMLNDYNNLVEHIDENAFNNPFK